MKDIYTKHPNLPLLCQHLGNSLLAYSWKGLNTSLNIMIKGKGKGVKVKVEKAL